MKILQKEIVIKLQIEGIHQWSTCNLEEVNFLRYPHRHIFHITLTKKVEHNDRDIEIIIFKRKVLEYFGEQPVMLGNKSCETIAEELLLKFNANSVTVLEDNENGATVSL
jgi:hypothetical protein